MSPRVLLAATVTAVVLGQAGAAAAQPRAFCAGVLGVVAGVTECPEGLEEVGGAAIGLICMGPASIAPRLTGDQLEVQVRTCLPAGWTLGESQQGVVGGRSARFREYIRASDKLRLRVGELIILRDTTPRSARATVVEQRAPFLAIPPAP